MPCLVWIAAWLFKSQIWNLFVFFWLCKALSVSFHLRTQRLQQTHLFFTYNIEHQQYFFFVRVCENSFKKNLWFSWSVIYFIFFKLMKMLEFLWFSFKNWKQQPCTFANHCKLPMSTRNIHEELITASSPFYSCEWTEIICALA